VRDRDAQARQRPPGRAAEEIVDLLGGHPEWQVDRVFCAVLSPGTDKTNCGRPCDDHVVQLRDRIGVAHPLTADVGCRNTLWNAVPQSAAEAVPALLARGVRHFRVEVLDEGPGDVGRVVRAYRDLLAGRTTGRDVWRELNAANRVGVTRGTLEERRNPLAII
jgi:putative protease